LGKHRARLKAELAPAIGRLLQDIGAHDVGRHQVGRELNARELQVQHLAQRADQHGLAQAGHALQQNVAARDDCDQRVAHHVGLADDDFADLGLDGRGDFAKLLR
jgi:hypothetical protein